MARVRSCSKMQPTRSPMDRLLIKPCDLSDRCSILLLWSESLLTAGKAPKQCLLANFWFIAIYSEYVRGGEFLSAYCWCSLVVVLGQSQSLINNQSRGWLEWSGCVHCNSLVDETDTTKIQVEYVSWWRINRRISCMTKPVIQSLVYDWLVFYR
jgi:hypothetical protein